MLRVSVVLRRPKRPPMPKSKTRPKTCNRHHIQRRRAPSPPRPPRRPRRLSRLRRRLRLRRTRGRWRRRRGRGLVPWSRFPTGVRRLPFEPDPSNKRVDAALPAATPSESPQRQSSSGHFSKSEAVIQLEAPQVEALPQSPRGALGGARLPLFPGSCPQTKRRPTYKTHASLVG
ncbi:unnamed protein product [Prorocentrum cordatum]|uniref:Uncharacterized protein n=1 Tax=Prorocentrum cordatum TaxID=2364126 RepID=A0ABN9YFK2_9DINO|nr:unnamed protein product [Polarella glacialis]